MTNENINTIHGLDKPVHHYICRTLSNVGCLHEMEEELCGFIQLYSSTVILCCLVGEIIQSSMSMNDNNMTSECLQSYIIPTKETLETLGQTINMCFKSYFYG